jgi:hypothetical protein
MSEWRPIAECPDDLRNADLWVDEGEWKGRVTDCFKADGVWYDPVGCHGDAWPVEGVITHFMPLPARPLTRRRKCDGPDARQLDG